MDLLALAPSRIVEIAKLAFETPGADLLCFGESDQPSPAAARDALTAALDARVTRYADVRGIPPLRIALAHYLSALHARPVDESRVQVTGSGMAALNVALAATVRAGQRVVVHAPIWPNIPNLVRLRGAELDLIELEPRPEGGFRLDLERLEARLAGARAFVLNSPNNPTGWSATHAELAAILAICRRHHVWLLADEVYSRLTYDGAPAAPSLLDVAEPDDRVMVANSFSKAWAMTGWRLGWLVVPDGARERVTEIVEITHSSVAPFIQHAGVAALADTAFLAGFRDLCTRGRALVGEALAGIDGIRYAPPSGAFYAFVGIDGLTDSMALARRLLREHLVAVAPGSAFGLGGEGHLRICFAQGEERLRRAMRRLGAGLAVERPAPTRAAA
jgi:aspartate aminotransferase